MKSIINFVKLYDKTEPFLLENGSYLDEVKVAYTSYGKLNKERSNAILICHALTGDAHVAGKLGLTTELMAEAPFYAAMKNNQPGWWDDIIGSGKIIDTDKYFVICSNILGSCYGTTGPNSKVPQNGHIFGIDFPQVAVRDIVKVQKKLTEHLGIKSLHSIIGGSLGGMQAIEWAIQYPDYVRSIIPIATSAAHSPWAVAYNHIGRTAIMNDPEWKNGQYEDADIRGLSIARQIGMISYRTKPSFQAKFGRERLENKNYFNSENLFQVENYLNYQGKKLIHRFDPNSYIILSRTLDLHDVGFKRGPVDKILNGIQAKTLCIGIDTDILYPADEQKEIAKSIPGSYYREIKSVHGHDGFLIEFDQLSDILEPFLENI